MLAAPLRVAFAQEAPPDDATERMKERFEKGQEYYEKKQFENAASEFRAAYEIKPAVTLLFNEAVCYEKLKKYDAAAKLFRQYLEKATNPRDKEKVQKRITALEREIDPKRGGPTKEGEKRIADMEEAKPAGVFLIESKPPDASVYLDDKNTFLGKTPWNGTIDGKHKVIIVAQGFKEDEKEIVGRPGQVNNIYISLSAQHYLGWLEVKANIPSADVFIDDRTGGSAGRTPLAQNMTPGKHTIIVTKEGFTEDVKEVTIVGGESYKVEATLDRAPIGFVHVAGSTADGAVVKVDGKMVCEAAPCRFSLPSGERKITVEKKGLKPYVRKMNIQKATETALQVKLEEKVARTDLIWKFGFAAAFLGGGIFMGLQASSLKSDLQSDIDKGNPPIGPDDNRFLKGKIYAWAADGLLLLGVVTAAVGVISAFSEKGPSSKGTAESRDLATGIEVPLIPNAPPVIVAPAVGPGFAGVAAEVRW